MYTDYSNNFTRTFGFDELYEGQVVEVKEDNSCYVNIYKFFVNTKPVTEIYEADISVSTSDIENLNESFSVKQTNGILCKPFTFNTNQRIMNKGDNVLVLFLNGDPQRPYYIDAYLPSSIDKKNGDIIFKNNNIQIYTEEENNNPKLIIKLNDTKIEIDKDTKFTNNIIENNTTVESKPGDTVIIEGDPTNIDGELLKKYLEFNSIKRDFENLKDKYNVIISVADHYKLPEEDRKPLKDSYNELVELVEPILSDEVPADSIDVDTLNNTFLVYHKNYNSLLGYFLKIGGSGNSLTPPLPEVTDENLESVIRDMIYVVNTKVSKKFIKDIIEDGVFSIDEKKSLADEIIKINNEKQLLELFAPLYFGDNSIERFYLQYVEEYDNLNDYISPMMVDIEEDTNINKDEFFNKFMEYFKKRVQLYEELLDYTTKIYDNKKPEFDEYAKDGILNSSEKKTIYDFLKAYYDEKESLIGIANLYSVNTNNYEATLSILDSQIGKFKNDNEEFVDKDNFFKDFYKFVENRNKLLETIIAVSESYIDTLVEGIQIGVTNLVYNYSFLYDFKEWNFPGYNETLFKQILDDDCFEKFLYTDCPMVKGTLTPTFFKVQKNDYLVLSLYLRTIELTKLSIYITDSANTKICLPYTLDVKPSEDFKRYIIPVTINTSKLKFDLKNKPSLVIENKSIGKSFDLTKVQLEFGTNPSEPSPAPEDRKYEEENFKNIVHEFSSAIIQTTNELKLTVDSFYSKVTEDIEEFRKQNASITVELGNIDLNLSDLYQKSEQIVDNLGGMEIIKDSTTTYDRLCQLQLDYEGMHLSVKDLVSNVTNITGKIDGILTEGGRLDSIKGSLLDYSNDLKGMGGVLKKIDSEMSTYITYIDGVKDSISKIEKIDEATLTMKGTLNKIENTLGHVTGSNMLDFKYDKNGNVIGSSYIDNMKSEFSGVTTRLGKVETKASSLEQDVNAQKKIIGEFTGEDTSLSILERIGRLTVANDNITTQVGKLQGAIETNEKLIPTDLLNNFSKSHNLINWSPAGDLSFDEDGNIEISSALNVLTLQKYTDDWYFGLVGTNDKVTVESSIVKIDSDQLYKFSIFLKDHPNNTDGKWRIGARFFAKNIINIGGYINNEKELTKELWFDESRDNRITKFTNFTGYIYPFSSNFKNSELMIKGTSENCLRFSEDALYMQFIIEYSTERGTPLLYIDNPEMFEVKSSQIEQLKLLQDALISVEPDNIMMVVKDHKDYQEDLSSISKHADSLFDIAAEGINQLITDTTVLDDTGNPIKLRDAFNTTRSNLDGTMSTVAEIKSDMDSMRDNLILNSGLSITGNNIFKLNSDHTIVPSSITLYGIIKDMLGLVDNLDSIVLKWFIDEKEVTQGVSNNSRSITIDSSLLKDKDSIKVICKNEDESLYDEITIVKLVEGKNAVNLILSNEFIGLPASSEGIVTDYSKAYTYIDIYEGTNNTSNNWTISVENNVDTTGISGSLQGRRYTVTKATKDTAMLKIKASRVIDGNKIEVFKNLQINKIRKGAPGNQGNDGYSVILTNEAQPIPVKNTLIPFEATSYFTDIKVYRGSDEINNFIITIDEDVISQSDFDITVSNEPNLKSVEFRTRENKALSAKEGSIPIDIEIIDEATNVSTKVVKNLTWTCSIQGESAQIVTLTANCQVFKSHDGGKNYNPDYIIANAIFKNCKFDSWHISSEPGPVKFIPYNAEIHDGIIITSEYIKILSSSKLFNDKVSSISIKVQSDVKDMYDVITITRLYDRDDINDIAEKAKVAYSFIEQNSDKIEEAVIKSEFDKVITDLNSNIDALNKGKDKWAYDVYDDYRKERDPAIEAIIGYSPKAMDAIDDSETILLKDFDDKIIRFYTSVYVEKQTLISTTVRFFNKGTLYVNSTRVLQRLDNVTSAPIKLNFTKGWNTIEIVVLAGSIAGFVLDLPLSKDSKINAMNAYAILNDYTKAEYSYSEIEKTAESIKSTVADLSKGIEDVYSEIEQTKDDWNAKFVDKGYKNYVDNGDFATGKCEEWFECYYASNNNTPPTMADFCGYGPPSDKNKMLYTNNENCLEIKVVNLRDGAYGAAYMVEGLTIGEKYTLCAEVAGTDSEKAIFVADAGWRRYKTSYLGHLDGGVQSANWAKVALEFVAEHEVAYIVFRITKTLNANPGYLWAKRIGVYNGLGWRPFMRSGNEVYAGAEGEVKINMNGIHVKHSLSNTYTQLDSAGFKVFSVKTSSPIAWFGDEDGTYARIPKIHCDTIQAENLALIADSQQTDYYVIANHTGGDGSGRDDANACSSVDEVMQRIKQTNDITKPCILNRRINIHIRASNSYYGGFRISGFQDGGEGFIFIDVAVGAKFNDSVLIEGNSIPIQMNSPSWGNQSAHPRADIIVGNKDGLIIRNNSKRFVIGGLCIIGNNASGKAAVVVENSTVYLQCLDISLFNYGIRGQQSTIFGHALRGNANYEYSIYTGTIVYRSFSKLRTKYDPDIPYHQASMIHDVNDLTVMDSQHNPLPDETPPPPPPPTTQVFTQTFSPYNYYSVRSYREDGIYNQGSWNSPYGNWEGHANFGSAIRDFCRGGSNITMKIYMERKNSSHGNWAATPIHINGVQPGVSLSIGEGKWFNAPSSVVNDLAGGSELTSFYNGSAHYIIYNTNIKVQVTCTKQV